MATERLINFQRRGIPEDSPLSEWPYIPRNELSSFGTRIRHAMHTVQDFFFDPNQRAS